MLDFLSPVVEFFEFVGSILNTIITGISGISTIITSLVSLILSLLRILPNPLFPCLQAFMSVYLVIFIFKIIRKG